MFIYGVCIYFITTYFNKCHLALTLVVVPNMRYAVWLSVYCMRHFHMLIPSCTSIGQKGRFNEWFVPEFQLTWHFVTKFIIFYFQTNAIDAGVRFHVTFHLLISSSLLARLLCSSNCLHRYKSSLF